MKFVIIDADKTVFTKDKGYESVPECFKKEELREALKTKIHFPRIIADCECELISSAKTKREGDFSLSVTDTAYTTCRYAVDDVWDNYKVSRINKIYAESSLHCAEELEQAY